MLDFFCVCVKKQKPTTVASLNPMYSWHQHCFSLNTLLRMILLIPLRFSVSQSQKQNIDLTRQAKFASTPAFALFVTLKNVVCKIGEDAEVLMSLYDPVESKFIR